MGPELAARLEVSVSAEALCLFFLNCGGSARPDVCVYI